VAIHLAREGVSQRLRRHKLVRVMAGNLAFVDDPQGGLFGGAALGGIGAAFVERRSRLAG
jgi:hypothetical protein